jgi:phage I-like protein
MSKQNSALSKIVLDDSSGSPSAPKKIQILRVGKWSDPYWGEWQITPEMLAEAVRNFNANVCGREISFDYFHDNLGVASGWVKALTVEGDGDQLWAEVDWTPKAKAMIESKELKYFSSEFAFKYTDVESGKEFENVLLGGGLTNRPYVKNMKAVAASERNIMNLQEQLTEAQGKVKTLSEQIATLQGQVTAKDSEVKSLSEKLTKAEGDLKTANDAIEAAKADAKKAARTAKFNELMSSGKACEAQREAFMAEDMDKFLELAQKPNLGGKGSGAVTTDSDDREKKVAALAETKMKNDPSMSRAKAFSEANAEIQ